MQKSFFKVVNIFSDDKSFFKGYDEKQNRSYCGKLLLKITQLSRSLFVIPEINKMKITINIDFISLPKNNALIHLIQAISSMAGIHAFAYAVNYSASKFAVTGFMQSLTEYLRAEGLDKCIHTTCIMPYYISTRADIMDFLNPE